MTKPRSFVCDDCGTPTTRIRQAHEPLICAPCGKARAIAWNDREHQDRLTRRVALDAQRSKQGRAVLKKVKAPPYVPPGAPLTGHGNNLFEAFADLNRQEADRAAGLLDSP